MSVVENNPNGIVPDRLQILNADTRLAGDVLFLSGSVPLYFRTGAFYTQVFGAQGG